MSENRRPRRWIALLAAYAVALQALLPVVLAAAAPSTFPICAGLAADPSAPMLPGDHGGGVAPGTDCCGALCHSPSLPPPQAGVSADVPPASADAGLAAASWSTPAAPRGPQSPRAPPAS